METAKKQAQGAITAPTDLAMPDTFDQSAFIASFQAEANEYLGTLSQGLINLEKHPDQPAPIGEMFRAAHTLKGVARMMGFMEIQDIAHHLENLFGRIKEGTLVLQAHMTDRALAAIDAIAKIIEAVVGQKPIAVDVASICQSLERSMSNETKAAAVDTILEPTLVALSAPPQTAREETKPTSSSPANVPESGRAPSNPKPKSSAKSANDMPGPFEKQSVSRTEEFIRIPISRVNSLFNLVGELVVHKVKS